MTNRATNVSLLLLLALAVGSLPPGSAAPAPVGAAAAPGDEVVALWRGGEDGRVIHLVDPSGGEVGTVAHGAGDRDADPAFSPTGDRIAFARRPGNGPAYGVWWANSDGTGAKRLTAKANDDRQPAWSPDGSQLAFSRSDPVKRQARIFVMDDNGSNGHGLTDFKNGTIDASPAWNPDPTADQIAFVSDRDGGYPKIWLMGADGSNEHGLTDSEDTCLEGNPAWSPDGQTLAFDRYCDGGVWHLVLWDVATGTETVPFLATPELEARDPEWSPTGTELAFSGFPVTGGNRDIWKVNALGGTATPVTTDTNSDLGPDWHVFGDGSSARAEEDQALVPTSDPEETSGTTESVVRGTVSPGSVVLARKRHRRGNRFRVKKKRIAAGIMYRRIKDRNGPQRIFVLTVTTASRPSLDVALAQDKLPGFERTTTMAKRHGAIAGVNGDFGLTSGRPAHPFAKDGDLKQTATAYGFNFASSQDGSDLHLGHRSVELESIETDPGEVWDVHRWNDGRPALGQLAGYSPAGGSLEKPPAHACSARLSAPSNRHWASGGDGIVTDHTVEEVSCDSGSMDGQGGIVLSAEAFSDEAAMLQALTSAPPETVSLTWSVGWDRVADTLGGYPRLVRNGKVVATHCTASLCRRHPRTAVGIRANGKVMLVVVDGRRKRWSKGMTLVQLARQMKRLGAVSALNLDGGGSSTMWIRGKGIVNRPSDRRERYVSSALLVLNGGDPSESSLSAAGRESVAPESAPADGKQDPQAGTLAIRDPASTGGFLDALASGEVAGPSALPPELMRLLGEFRAWRAR